MGDCWGGEKTVSISMCLSGRRMHVWMLTPRIIRGGEHRKVDSGAYDGDLDAHRFCDELDVRCGRRVDVASYAKGLAPHALCSRCNAEVSTEFGTWS